MIYSKKSIFTFATLFLCLSLSSDELKLARSMYANSRAFSVGDLITVIISEESSSNKSETVKTDKASSFALSEGTLGGANNSRHRWDNIKTIIPPMSVSGTSNFDGAGSASSSETLSARYTARVIDVLPNSVMLIRGERLINKNGEKIKMVLSGLVRQQDISATNTISSDLLSDARINYETSGHVSTSSKPGWLMKIFQAINPF